MNYITEFRLLGMLLVHVATGRLVGGVSAGGVSVGGLAAGVFSLGGLAVGALAVGGAANFALACQLVEDRRCSKSLKLAGFSSELADRFSLVAKGLEMAALGAAQWL